MSYQSFRQIIGLWTDLGEFAGDIGVPENTAKAMRFRDSVAPRHWQKLVDAARARKFRDVTLDELARLKAAQDQLSHEQCGETV